MSISQYQGDHSGSIPVTLGLPHGGGFSRITFGKGGHVGHWQIQNNRPAPWLPRAASPEEPSSPETVAPVAYRASTSNAGHTPWIPRPSGGDSPGTASLRPTAQQQLQFALSPEEGMQDSPYSAAAAHTLEDAEMEQAVSPSRRRMFRWAVGGASPPPASEDSARSAQRHTRNRSVTIDPICASRVKGQRTSSDPLAAPHQADIIDAPRKPGVAHLPPLGPLAPSVPRKRIHSVSLVGSLW
ncbi:hypothetical protein CYMTET_50756 [Cymbomonas tetramitiformis]|uniref:Uncharacterized protein n=1 Tax=Cymbomonas tetramitiformis TaxID=36881 RepID=A0AAE0BNK6_9CHLO|nr:hypothetical protein CYMTET_50756 [Cymbomonas tetramitiformis]